MKQVARVALFIALVAGVLTWWGAGLYMSCTQIFHSNEVGDWFCVLPGTAMAVAAAVATALAILMFCSLWKFAGSVVNVEK